MKKLLFAAALFLASFAADAQVTHRFGFAKDFTIPNGILSADSLTKTYNIQVVIFDQYINTHYPGNFEEVRNYRLVVADGKTDKQITAIAKDSIRAYVKREFPNF